MMMAALRRYFFETTLRQELERRTRNLTIQSVRAYIKVLYELRRGLIGVMALIGIVSILVSGILLVVGSLISFLPIEVTTGQWVALIGGLILTAIGTTVLYLILDQKRWLEMSRAYDLMDAALSPQPLGASVQAMKHFGNKESGAESGEPMRPTRYMAEPSEIENQRRIEQQRLDAQIAFSGRANERVSRERPAQKPMPAEGRESQPAFREEPPFEAERRERFEWQPQI